MAVKPKEPSKCDDIADLLTTNSHVAAQNGTKGRAKKHPNKPLAKITKKEIKHKNSRKCRLLLLLLY